MFLHQSTIKLPNNPEEDENNDDETYDDSTASVFDVETENRFSWELHKNSEGEMKQGGEREEEEGEELADTAWIPRSLESLTDDLGIVFTLEREEKEGPHMWLRGGGGGVAGEAEYRHSSRYYNRLYLSNRGDPSPSTLPLPPLHQDEVNTKHTRGL